jgi:methionine aminotransferase
MSALASKHNAINLSQGFPEFPVSEELIALVHQHMIDQRNQYAPMQGVLSLRERIAEKVEEHYHTKVDPDTEVTITAGATEAIYATIAALVWPGDEVIILEPAYDSYVPAVLVNGGIAVPVHLNPDFSVNWQAVEEKITNKTRMIMVNTPHNPSGMIFSAADLDHLARITRDSQIVVLSDEVYEHIIFDGCVHQSVLRDEELAMRSVTVSSFGKTFHATGWKVGYCIAPACLTKEIRKVHQYLQFSVHTPTQYALADFLADNNTYTDLAQFYQRKRDLFLQQMKASPFRPLIARGTYFQLFSFQGFSDQPDKGFAEYLTREVGVASIPISVFYQDGTDHHLLRFCFAKNDETLLKAASILSQLP